MSLEALLRNPTFDDFLALRDSKQGSACRVPVVQTLPADSLTPVAAYLRLRDQSSHSFLFESIEGGEHLARYSFVGFRPSLLLRVWPDRTELEGLLATRAGEVEHPEGNPLNLLRSITSRAPLVDVPGLPRFLGGAVGFFSYDSVRLIEDVPRRNPDPLDTPDINLAFHDRLLAFDHLRALVHLVRIVELHGDESSAQARALWDEARADLTDLEQQLRLPLPQKADSESGRSASTCLLYTSPSPRD